MIINMIGGGGGAALNFTVVPGLTQPGTASENTIWVETEQIGSWYFSATQPEGLQEWDVWFQMGTKSDVEFNALRKNGLQVYPLRVMQRINGADVNVLAQIYQTGKWIPLQIYLYDNGNECEDITGGWVSEGILYSSTNNLTAVAPTVTKNGDSVTLTQGGDWKYGIYRTKNKINFDNRNSVTCKLSNVKHDNYGIITLGVYTEFGKYAQDTNIASVSIAANDTSATLDVSNIEGSGYLAFCLMSGDSHSGAPTSKMTLHETIAK